MSEWLENSKWALWLTILVVIPGIVVLIGVKNHWFKSGGCSIHEIVGVPQLYCTRVNDPTSCIKSCAESLPGVQSCWVLLSDSTRMEINDPLPNVDQVKKCPGRQHQVIRGPRPTPTPSPSVSPSPSSTGPE